MGKDPKSILLNYIIKYDFYSSCKDKIPWHKSGTHGDLFYQLLNMKIKINFF